MLIPLLSYSILFFIVASAYNGYQLSQNRAPDHLRGLIYSALWFLSIPYFLSRFTFTGVKDKNSSQTSPTSGKYDPIKQGFEDECG